MTDVAHLTRFLLKRRLLWCVAAVAGVYLMGLVISALADVETNLTTFAVIYSVSSVGGMQAVLFLVLAAALTAETMDRGVIRERYLAGISAWRSLISVAAAATLVGLILIFIGEFVAIAVGVLYQLSRTIPPPHGPPVLAPSASDLLMNEARGLIVALVLYGCVGAAIGVLTRKVSRAVSWAVGLAMAMWLLRRAAYTYPALRWPAFLDLDGIANTALDGRSDPLAGALQASPAYAFGAGAIWLVVALVACSSVTADPILPVRTGGSAAYERRGAPRLWMATLLTSAVVCAAVGATLPLLLRDALPWRLQPSWLLDKAEHRSSLDITNALLRALETGDTHRAASLTVDRSLQHTLTVFYARLVAPGAPAHARLNDYAPSPGSVVVTRGQLKVIFCLTREPSGWRVRSVTTLTCDAGQ